MPIHYREPIPGRYGAVSNISQKYWPDREATTKQMEQRDEAVSGGLKISQSD
jgi:hypothetical protein